MVLFAEIYTDGSCHTQQCVGAWASVILIDNEKVVLSGKEIETTHNRMEILAVINSIKYILQNFSSIKEIKIVSDSQYVIGLVDRKYKFIKSDYKTKAGIDIRNIDLVKELLTLLTFITVEFVKIKAHQKPNETVNYNIEVDKLSRQIVREAVNKKQ
jgi:ribonuclease HI